MPCNTVNSDMFSFMQDTLRIRCPFSYVSIQEGVDSSATTTNTLAERAPLVQVCHIELNAQGVTEPGQQGSQEDPGLLLDHHGLCHYRLLSEHDVNYTKAANVKLTNWMRYRLSVTELVGLCIPCLGRQGWLPKASCILSRFALHFPLPLCLCC